MIRGDHRLDALAGIAPAKSGAADRVAAPIGFTVNGELSQNTALAGLLSSHTRMHKFAGDMS
jgi:hypothetical protein